MYADEKWGNNGKAVSAIGSPNMLFAACPPKS
jgi:hypothetical protein